MVAGCGRIDRAAPAIFSNAAQEGRAAQRLVSLGAGLRTDYRKVAWLEHPFTGTGAGTSQYTRLGDRQGIQGVKQVHNLYLEQGTETGIVAFLTFAAVSRFRACRAAWLRRPEGEGQLLLAGVVAAITGVVAAITLYLASSVFEWHWHLPGSTLVFFVLTAAVRLARTEAPPKGVADDETSPGSGRSPCL